MNKIINLRDESIAKLKSFLNNPGYFSILILGDSGTGKEYILKNIINSDKELKKLSIVVKYPFEIGETEKEIELLFQSDIIVIKNIEELSDIQQHILHKSLSTSSNGEIGLNETRGLKRIIFTSSYNIEQLRESKEFISDRFWNRISQLIVKIPSFKEYGRNICNDFNSVWNKMAFLDFNTKPKNGDFLYWLTENCESFAGNFRDLDTIAILWHQYRIIAYKILKQKFKSETEAKIYWKVKNDFKNYNHFPTQKSDNTNVFEFEKGKPWKQIDRDFKSKFKIWARKEYSTIKNATEELNMPLRKMDKW